MMTWNPDKADAGGEPTGVMNSTRAARAMRSVTVRGAKCLDPEDPESNIVDTIVDLGHLCDREGFDFDELVARARRHWVEER